MKKGIVFDLDGTLVDSIPGISEGLNLALSSLNYPTHSEESIRKMVGQGARELCRAALSIPKGEELQKSQIDALLGAFMKEYPQVWLEGTNIFEGVLDGLSRLKEKGLKLAVLSNKPHEVTAPMVKTLFPQCDFEPIMGYSTQFPRKPDPAALLHIIDMWGFSLDEVCLVGDSIHDGETATNASVDFVPVGWGYCNREELQNYGAIHDDVASLFRHLQTL